MPDERPYVSEVGELLPREALQRLVNALASEEAERLVLAPQPPWPEARRDED